MKKSSLRTKFILYFTPLIVSIFFFGAYCIHVFSSIHKQLNQLQQDITPNAFTMMELKELLVTLESSIKQKQINQEQIASNIEKLRKIVSSHPDHEDKNIALGQKSSHDMMHKAFRTMSLSEYVVKQSATGWQDSDLAEVANIVHHELISLGPVLDQHLKIHLQELTRTETFVAKKYRQTLVFVIVAGIVITFATVIMLTAIIRSVLGPVKILREGAKQIGEGNLDYQLEIVSGDEFEFLASEFSSMAAKLTRYHATLDQKVQERTEELSVANAELQKEIIERKKAQEEQQLADEQVHLLSQELLKVQEAERQKISLDLHDNVAQELSSLKIAGESIFGDFSDTGSSLRRQIDDWGKSLDRCIKTVRELSYNLRPPGLEQIGLPSALTDYCRNFSKKSGVVVKFSTAGIDNLQLEYNYAINIYRLVQEALNNIKKHAQARTTKIKLIASYPNIILRIEDDGQGFILEQGFRKAHQNKRLGLLGMQERVRMLNGVFKIVSKPQQGTRIFIEFPWSTNNDNN